MKIRIRDYIWTIAETNDKTNENFWGDDRLLQYGECDYVTQTITIWKDISLARKYETMIHELTHAFIDVYWDNRKDNYNEEDMCKFSKFMPDILYFANLYLTKVKENSIL